MAKDLITGFALQGASIEWTALRRSRGGNQPAGSGIISLDLSAGVGLDGEGDAAETGQGDLLSAAETRSDDISRQIKTQCSAVEGDVAVALPPGNVLMRVVELPTTEPEELRSMAELQVDKFSPFPSDNTVTSYEVLRQSETSTSTLVAAAKRDVVLRLGAVLTGARIFPHRLDVETLCWLRLLADAGDVPETGCRIVVILDTAACEVVVVQDGSPVLFRSLGRPGDLAADEICEELDYTFTTLEVEHGISEVTSLMVGHRGEEPQELIAALRAAFSFEIGSKSLDSLPALSEGLVRRSLDTERTLLNLALPEWQAGEKTMEMRRNLLFASIAVLAVWLAGVGGLFGVIQWQKSGLASAEARLGELEAPSREARNLRRMLMQLEQYTNTTFSALECLREATVLKPKGVIFRNFDYDSAKRRVVRISGEASSANAVLDFGDALAKSSILAGGRLDGPREQPGGKYTFAISIDLPTAKE